MEFSYFCPPQTDWFCRMKNSILISIIGCLFLSLSSCKQHQHNDDRLVRADSLMQFHPDSALHLLQNTDISALHGKADLAYYALLLTQARDKSNIIQTNDSLINIAVRYYDSIGSPSMQAKAHFYRGCIYRDQNKCPLAIRDYFTSIALAKNTKSENLIPPAYVHIGHICYEQTFDDAADSIFQVAEQEAIRMKDTLSLAESLSRQGLVKMEKGVTFLPQAEKQMLQALAMTSHLPDRNKGNIYECLSDLYSKMQNGQKALQYALLNLSLHKDTTCYKAYSLLGDAYYKTAKYDTATVYFVKSLSSKNRYIKADAYMRLADIAKENGQTMASLEYERLYSAYLDSMQRAVQDSTLLAIGEGKQILSQTAKPEARAPLFLMGIISILGIAILSLFVLRKRKIIKCQKTDQECIAKSLPVYNKMKRIIQEYRQYEKSKETMTKEDWDELITESNLLYNNLIGDLEAKYKLSPEEQRICCLYMLDFPTSHLRYLLNCSRDTVYRKSNAILDKIQKSSKKGTLKEELRSYKPPIRHK